MQPSTPRPRLRPAIGVFTAMLLASTSIGQAAAESASPFGDSARVADAQLDTMRGGFAGSDGSLLRFGINLETSVNGHPIASLSISNDASGKITASERNFGRTFVLKADGSVQITQAIPGHAGSHHHHHHHSGTGLPSGRLPTTVSVPLNNGTQSSSGVIVTTTLVPTGGASISTNGLLASTGLLPNGHGVMTLIQNTQSNVVIRTLNTLNVQVSGLGNSAVVRNSTTFRGFANSMNFSVRH